MGISVGDRLTAQTTFRAEPVTPGTPGALTSPSTVVGEVKSPSGAITPLTPSEASAGIWRATLPTFTEGGYWRWFIAGTAGLIAADQGSIAVEAKVTAP